MNSLFFELLKVAIGYEGCLSKTPSEKEWLQLYRMAEVQALLGVCFAGVRKIEAQGQRPPEQLYYQWLAVASQILQRNELVNRQCIEVQRQIEEAGFRTFIMKGQGNAAIYADDLTMLRQSGDIDIYLDGGFKRVMAFVNSTFPSKEVNELEIHYHCLKDTEVEIHYHPSLMRNPVRNRKLQRFFEKEMEPCFANSVSLPNGIGNIHVPTLRFNLIHQMAHIYGHLFTLGIGLRQFMDYYYLLARGKKDGVRSYEPDLQQLGLAKFASAVMWVLGHVFGLEQSQMIVKPNEKDGRFLLEEVMAAGNFGRYDDRLSHGDVTKWQSFWRVTLRNLRLMRFNHWDWFWGPLWRIYHFMWRKINGYK